MNAWIIGTIVSLIAFFAGLKIGIDQGISLAIRDFKEIFPDKKP